MPARRAYQGHLTPPSGQQGSQLAAPEPLVEIYYFSPISGSDHLQIEQDPTSAPLWQPNARGGEHLDVRSASDGGSLPIRSIPDSDHLQIG